MRSEHAAFETADVDSDGLIDVAIGPPSYGAGEPYGAGRVELTLGSTLPW